MNKDCFAYGNDQKCKILKFKKCNKCPFYKTSQQLEIECKKAKKRLALLNVDKQAYILDKYGLLKSKF